MSSVLCGLNRRGAAIAFLDTPISLWYVRRFAQKHVATLYQVSKTTTAEMVTENYGSDSDSN